VCRQITLGGQIAKEIAVAAHALIQTRVTELSIQRMQVRDEEAALLTSEMQLTQAFSSGDLAPNAFNDQTADIRAKRQQLAQLRTAAPVSAGQLTDHVSRTLQLATSFWDLYEPMNDIRRASLLKALFGTIVLDHEGVAGFTLNEPFTALMSRTEGQRQPTELAKRILDAA